MSDKIAVGAAGTPLDTAQQLEAAGWSCRTDGLWTRGDGDALPYREALAVLRYATAPAGPTRPSLADHLNAFARSFNGTIVLAGAAALVAYGVANPPDFLTPQSLAVAKWALGALGAVLTAVQVNKQMGGGK